MAAIFAGGVLTGWVSHNAVLRASGEVKTWFAERKAGKVNEQASADTSRIGEEAAKREVAISDSGTDNFVSYRLECLFRFPDQTGISHCLQVLLSQSQEALSPAKAPANGK
jgi:hypothetical protein